MSCKQHTREAELVISTMGGRKVYFSTESPFRDETPWGFADYATRLDGMTDNYLLVGTPSHGGVGIRKAIAFQTMSKDAIKCGQSFGDYLWFEEDCDWAVAAWENPHLWDTLMKNIGVGTGDDKNDSDAVFERRRKTLLKTISEYNLDYLEKTGETPDEESAKLARERKVKEKMRKERHPDLIVSACGDWKTGIKGVYEVTTADGKSHLIKGDSYKNSGGLNLLSSCVPFEQ